MLLWPVTFLYIVSKLVLNVDFKVPSVLCPCLALHFTFLFVLFCFLLSSF